jgi:spore germination cell wall hydrolase CwlJ-like protein
MLSFIVGLALAVAPLSTDSTNTDEVNCLARNIYFEAPAEPLEGKIAVAQVTINRTKHKNYPATICGVVYQQNKRGCQFSWVCEPPRKIDSTAFARAKKIATQVLAGKGLLKTLSKALFFHNDTVNPKWASEMQMLTKIGGHTFYAAK